MNEELKIPVVVFSDAIDAAVSENVDIINLSAGRHRPGCIGGACGFCRIAKSAFDEGVTIVTAAGDSLSGDHTIYCPAYAEQIIGVGGFEVCCTFDPSGSKIPTEIKSPIRPPLAYWTRKWSEYEYPAGSTEEAYCSDRDCSLNGSCEQFRGFREWPKNPSPAGSKPDVLAPIHYVEQIDYTPYILGGTSYGAPIVSGVIAWALDLLLDNQRSASPYQIQQAVIKGGEPVKGASADRLDAQGMLDELL